MFVGLSTCRNSDLFVGLSTCQNNDLFVGISTCRNNDLSEYRPVGITTCRNNDLFVGISTCRNNDLSEYRAVGIATCRNNDPEPFLITFLHRKASQPLYKIKGTNPSSFPPSSSVGLLLEKKRSNLVTSIWKNALSPEPMQYSTIGNG